MLCRNYNINPGEAQGKKKIKHCNPALVCHLRNKHMYITPMETCAERSGKRRGDLGMWLGSEGEEKEKNSSSRLSERCVSITRNLTLGLRSTITGAEM